MINVIYFTKEDGQNKFLYSSPQCSTSMIDLFDDKDREIAEKRLGHEVTNVYALIDGVEIKIL